MKSGRYIGALVLGVALGVWAFSPLYALPATADAQTLTADQKAKLQAEYDQLQQEIAQWQKILDDTRAKKSSLTGDVTALNAQIKQAQTEIQQRNITITTLGSEINQKTATISTLQQQLDAGHEALAKLIRQKNEAEQQPIAILALSSQSLSDFFNDVDSIDTLNGELQTLFNNLRGVKDETQKEKDALDAQQSAQLDARHEVQVKQDQIKQSQAQKQQLLNITKQNEQSYSQVLADRQKRATEIRNALFQLRDSAGISFDSALQYATQAQAATGVRAAFILGILRQESNLGTNVGQCLLVDPDTGYGKGKNTGAPVKNVMKPDRDVQPFLNLMAQLGGNPYNTPVSCPQSVGYGGAMGPSQFIPSTWVLYQKRLSTALGVDTPDPWAARDAIMAMALYLKDLRADRGTYSSEIEAAGRYYAGANWKTSGAAYAKSVLSFADKYQSDIDFLNSN